MASRKDELSAYSFARKRMVAGFLAPSPGGSDEGAPRPLRTVMPSLGLGMVLTLAFVGWGVIKPGAPQGWDDAGQYIVVDSDSTTRYVVIDDKGSNGKKVKTLHPVLNYASAKLLLDKGKGQVIEVKGDVIDKSGLPHGATLGIPYAPDRLPDADDAAKAKVWAVCERPAAGSGSSVDRAVFVLDAGESKAVTGKDALTSRQMLYVRDASTGTRYLVDSEGTRFQLGDTATGADTTEADQLRSAVAGQSAQPQQVSAQWLATLNPGTTVEFPDVPGIGTPTGVHGVPTGAGTVGRVLRSRDAQGTQYYVVLKDRIAAITPFVAELLKSSPNENQAYGSGTITDVPVNSQDVIAADGGQPQGFYTDRGWPREIMRQANTAATAGGRARDTSCSVYRGTIGAGGRARLSVWAGSNYPKTPAADEDNAYVSSGSGLLFREVSGSAAGGGATYLLTDTGLRYALPSTNDSTAADGAGTDPGDPGSATETDKARTRLGYEKITNAAVVPSAWAELIPKGPTLDTGSASRPQSQ